MMQKGTVNTSQKSAWASAFMDMHYSLSLAVARPVAYGFYLIEG